MGSVLLLTLWTLWLVAALPLTVPVRDSAVRLGVLAAFLVGALVVWIATPLPWRAYVMAGLAAHIGLEIWYLRRLGFRPYRLAGAVLSFGGLLWVWLHVGAPYAAWVIGVPTFLAALGGAGYYGWRAMRQQADEAVAQVRTAAEEALAAKDAELREEAVRHNAASHRHHAETGRLEQRLSTMDTERRAEEAAARKEIKALRTELAGTRAALETARWEAGVWRSLTGPDAEVGGTQRAESGEPLDPDVAAVVAEYAEAARERPIRLGVYRCPACGAAWLIVDTVPGKLRVYGPLEGAAGCDQCRPWGSAPSSSSPAPETSLGALWPLVARQARPEAEILESEIAAESAEYGRKFALKLAADLAGPDWLHHVADHTAQLVNDPVWRAVNDRWPPERCLLLGRLADGLDDVRTGLRDGVATGVRWVATLTGVPGPIAAFFGEVIGRAFAAAYLEPLRVAAHSVRVLGVAACAEHGGLLTCACARGLAKELTHRVLTDRLEEAGRELLGIREDRIEATSGRSRSGPSGLSGWPRRVVRRPPGWRSRNRSATSTACKRSGAAKPATRLNLGTEGPP